MVETGEAQPDSRSEIRDGLRDAAPVLMAVLPFAAVFGALAVESGLTLAQTLIASATIYAGASQYAMLDLIGQNVPAWVIVVTIFAVNFRHLLYSAALGRRLMAFSPVQKLIAFFFLVDPLYASAESRARTRTVTPTYYFAYSAIIYSVWMGSNLLGAMFGNLIENPADFGLDFILPIYFIGLVVGFRSRPSFLPVMLVSAAAALAVYFTLGSPWHITLGGLAGLVTAAAISKPSQGPHRRKARRHV